MLRNSSSVMQVRACSRALPLFFANSASLELAETLIILRRPDVVVGDPLFEHVIDSTGDLVRCGHEGLCRTKSSFHAPREGAKRTMRAADRLGRHAESLCGTVAMLYGAALELTFRTLFRTFEAILEEPPAERGAGATYRLLHAL